MSLSSIKLKETKAKERAFPKLKTVLANPFMSEHDIMDIVEVGNIEEWLNEQITKSRLEPKNFAKSRNISIGLESVLRAIKNSLVSCVFLTLNIKPKYVIKLIVRFVELKSPKARVYGIPQLEKYTQKIFGIQALAFTFPAESLSLGVEIHKWIQQHQKPVNRKLRNPYKCLSETNSISSNKSVNLEIVAKISENNTNLKKKPMGSDDFQEDFIPFYPSANSATEASNLNLEEEKMGLLTALNKMTKEKQTDKKTCSIDKVDSDINLVTLPTITENNQIDTYKLKLVEEPEQNITDSYQFLHYQPLQVYKIRPNVDKKPRKNRNRKHKIVA